MTDPDRNHTADSQQRYQDLTGANGHHRQFMARYGDRTPDTPTDSEDLRDEVCDRVAEMRGIADSIAAAPSSSIANEADVQQWRRDAELLELLLEQQETAEKALNIVIDQAQKIAHERDSLKESLQTAWDWRDRMADQLREMRAERDAAVAGEANNASMATEYAGKAVEYKREKEAAEAERDAAVAQLGEAQRQIQSLIDSGLRFQAARDAAVARADTAERAARVRRSLSTIDCDCGAEVNVDDIRQHGESTSHREGLAATWAAADRGTDR